MKYSGAQITKAGNILTTVKCESDREFEYAMDVMSYWRSCHEAPLNLALEVLVQVVIPIDKKAIFAKRLKRFASIHSKLVRFSGMTLRSMQDIGGCRAVVATEKKLRQSVRELRRRREFRTELGAFRVKDYIKNPKPDGYRSYHLVGRFSGEDKMPRKIEIQIRTKIQHYWATAVEIVDIFTGQALKSNRGDAKWADFFREISLQFSLIDGIHIVDALPFEEKRRKFRASLVSVYFAKESGIYSMVWNINGKQKVSCVLLGTHLLVHYVQRAGICFQHLRYSQALFQ